MSVEACLSHIASLSADLSADIRSLDDAAWNGPTNCPPWRVRDLSAHLVSSGAGFVDSIRQGLAGSLEPSVPADERARRHAALEAASPGEVADALARVTAEFASLYDGLSESELETVCFHRRGNRSVRWYAAHRLAEVAFHGWDLHVSLDGTATLDPEVALVLLPTLLESNAPRTYAAGLSDERGSGERYMLRTDNSAWLVTLSPDALTATPTSDATADVTITAPPSALALLVYGRANLRDPDFDVHGDPSVAARFARVFPKP